VTEVITIQLSDKFWTEHGSIMVRTNGCTIRLSPHPKQVGFAKLVRRKGGTPEEYAVFLDREHISVLPMLDTRFIPTRVKKRGAHQTRGRQFYIPQRCWRIPDSFTEWAREMKAPDVERWLARLFMEVAQTYEYSNYGMVCIAVHNGDLTAQFVVDPRRFLSRPRHRLHAERRPRALLPYRQGPRTAHQKRRRRSQDAFPRRQGIHLAGNRVTVTVPVRDHVALTDFDVGATGGYWLRKGEKSISRKQLERRLQGLIEGAPLQSLGKNPERQP
jgi:hypothetical protein